MAVSLSDYNKVRQIGGLFDATNYHGRLFARGKDAIDLLHRMSSNDLKPIEATNSLVAMTFLTNEKARIIDLLTVVRDEQGETLLVTSRGKEETVRQWLAQYV